MEFLEKLEKDHSDIQLLNTLQTRRDKLKQQLRKLQRQSFDVHVDFTEGDDPDKQEYRSLVDILDTYRLLGVSIVDTNDAALTLRLDCLYKDQFPASESHCIQLGKKGDNYTLGQHNLPPFIPVKQIAEKCLANSVDLFVTEVRNYLYAYIRRRGNIQEIQAQYEDRLQQEVVVDLSVSFVTLVVKVDDSLPNVRVQLQYELLKCLPNSVVMDFVEDAVRTPDTVKTQNKKDRLVNQWKTCLTEMDIVTAFSKLLSQGGRV